MPSAELDQVRDLFQRCRSAVLCSAHVGLDGWPYGSVVPYAMLSGGDLVVMLSDIAEHTRNLLGDPRATMLVADPAMHDDPQAGARHAMMVRARAVEGADLAAAEDCYFERFPKAREMLGAHGFRLWILECERIRWIAGFGSMGWIDRAQWTGQRDPLADHREDILDHLNADHADSLLELAHGHVDPEAVQARAVDVDRGGLEICCASGGAERVARLPFATPAATPEAARIAILSLLRQIRR